MVTCSSSNDSSFSPSPSYGNRWLSLICLLGLVASSPPAHSEWVEWMADIDLGFNSIENLNRSGFAADEEDDSSISLEGSFGRAYQVNGNLRYTLSADLRADIFDEFGDLDSHSFGITATARHKFGTGLTVPWIKGLLSPSYLDVKDDIRSGSNLLADIQVGKRYSERLDVVGGLRYKSRSGKDAPSASPPIGGTVFDQDNLELYLSSSYLITPRWLGSLGLAYMDGEIDSACTPSNLPTVLANEKLKGIVTDNVFGGCVFRVKAKATTYSLDMSYALGSHNSVNLGYQLQSAKTSYRSYKNTIISLSYKYSY